MKKKWSAVLSFLLSLCMLCSCGAGTEESKETSAAESSAEASAPEASDVSEIELSEEESKEPEDPLSRVWESVEVISEYDIHYDSAGMFLYRSDVGLVLQKGDMTAPLYPASITKVAAALTALKWADPETVIEAGNELDLVARDSTIAYIRKGQKLTVAMLIRAMLLPSGCDASYVLAAGVGRLMDPGAETASDAVAVFVEGMNEFCKDVGCVGSHWVNPDGYHDPEHYTCMADLLRLASLAMENAVVRDCASCGSIDVTYASGESNHWENTNAFVRKDSPLFDPTCVGLKTGTTDEAGACLLSCFEENGVLTIIGVFGCQEKNSRFSVTSEIREKYRFI